MSIKNNTQSLQDLLDIVNTLSDIEGIGTVIEDLDNNKQYKYQLKIVNSKPKLYLYEIEEAQVND